ncbi:6-phosphofructokinase [soil metagenome]
MRHIAILTSGGDAPGMNAAIRAATREALARAVQVSGIQHGFAGLLGKNTIPLTARAVGGIIQRGGTMLGSARCDRFRTEEGVREGAEALRMLGIEGLVVIGGNGSQAGAMNLANEGIPVVGVASTIDNDLCGSDITIGVDTALNIALEAIDRLRVTASSHRRAFVVEVMGRDCGYLALMAGLAGGAETVVIPEVPTTPEEVANALRAAYDRGKTHALAVVAEGAATSAVVLEQYFLENKHRLAFELRATTLGHVQRGGTPGAFDRILATRLGSAAADALLDGKTTVLAGWQGGRVTLTPHHEIVGRTKQPAREVLDLLHRLAQ